MAKNITTREKDYSQWYLDVIKAAELADYSPVRGCMVIRPNGFALWEAIQRDLDRRFKETGHVNAYFPLLIPVSFLAKEAKHIEGFAMECAVVTHSGLEKNPNGDGLVPKNPLEEPLIVRPTSETVIGHMYAQWVQSWRDLPILINQWANVMRWEMRTRLFLRTSEFLWQEGHTAHETAEEAQTETMRMLDDVYRAFAEEFLAVPVLAGEKTARERFPGAAHTYAIEALMQDRKALQAGTSHNLGQNFSKAFDIKFEGRDQTIQHAWTTSWGVSTRLIGALIMTHSDDEGLILPPRVAPTLAAIVPIWKSEEDHRTVGQYAKKIICLLVGQEEFNSVVDRRIRASHTVGSVVQHDTYKVYQLNSNETSAEANDRAAERGFARNFNYFKFDGVTFQNIAVDHRDNVRPGEKHYHWEQRGVPFRFEIGPRDVAEGKVVVKSRLGEAGEKQAAALGLSLPAKESVPVASITRDWFTERLNTFQRVLFERSCEFRKANTHHAATKDELYAMLKDKGGFVHCFFADEGETSTVFEEKVKADIKATVRVILPPQLMSAKQGPCVMTGKPCAREVVFAVAY